ncbi:MAG TPA: glycerol-3-phosphate acyltransferase [Anaerolineales bacterium]|nr:glycerol-3-phosphate acyltransferase [Anaerolineales bacterium]
MDVLQILFLIFLAYLLGSIPSGLIIVMLFSGKDIRRVESGRTGGTNAMRAAGYYAGVLTGILDLLKAAVAVWLAQALFPVNPWIHVFAALAAILGHNYSIFLLERGVEGRARFRGGAGGAPTVGAAFAMWPWSLLFVLPLSSLVFYFVGYASLTTISAPLIITLVFAYRAWIGASPWAYAAYGVLAEIILLWALRPNIRRLLNGTERLVGYRARKKKPESPADYSSSSSSSSK